MRTYRVAIVGTGGIAAIHARDLATLGAQAAIVAAVDVDPARLDAFAATWKVPQRFTSLEEMLRRAAPDVVHLCTPPALHREQALACLAAGVTTLCEKPPALSLAELDEIAAAQTATARFATVFQHRFGSGLRRLRHLLAQPFDRPPSGSKPRTRRSGRSPNPQTVTRPADGPKDGPKVDPRVGRPLTAVCNTLWFRPDEYFAVPWRGRWEVEGGGPTLGHGIHQMDLLLAALGPWQEVAAVAGRRARRTATEDVSAALVTFADGTVATVLNSLVAPRQTSYVRVDLEHATVELEHLYGYDDANWTVTAAPGHEEEVAAAWAEGPPNLPSGHAAQFAAVLEALQAGSAPPVGPAEARPTMELVAAMYASAFTGARVRAGEIGPGSPFYTRMDGHGAPWSPRAPAAVR